MKKLSGLLITVVVLAGLLGIGTQMYVSVDDLAGCEDRPTTGGCVKADAIVAISGGDTSARTAEAVELYKRGWAGTLIVSGAALDPTGPSNAATMRAEAIRAGVPSNRILVDELSQDTSGNAKGVAMVAREHDLRRVIVVTSPYHQRRAELVFERAFMDFGSVRSHPTQGDQYWPPLWWTQPGSWILVIGEMAKTVAELSKGSQP
ncbi:YdcF family protein [Candidatus Saccharibacteria bacterium]|nr:YdcF family protein [Candidatus Saccharibacteria bacterium]